MRDLCSGWVTMMDYYESLDNVKLAETFLNRTVIWEREQQDDERNQELQQSWLEDSRNIFWDCVETGEIAVS